MELMVYHDPVLLKESVDALVTDPNGIYVDATFGGGGHSREILSKLDQGKLIAFDQDTDAIKNTIDDKRFMLVRSNFRYVKNFLQQQNLLPVMGILADLGISSHQFDVAERGFSTRFEATLDMRMNREAKLSARQVVNQYAEEELRNVFFEYGELRNAKGIARKIVSARGQKEIITTKELIDILESEAERGAESKFFARVFQALRIEVNGELDALKEFMMSCTDMIQSEGRLVVISYHSLEDRIVKNFIASGGSAKKAEQDVLFGQTLDTPFKALNKKPIEASEEEIEKNPRARSAKMRIAIKN